jgi:UDP:flavonoid glycosyltransferase YjiC (YdhE family)
LATRCLGRLACGVLRDLPELARREQFDGLVMDQIAIGTEAACEVCGVPLAVACNSLLLNAELRIPPITSTWPYATSFNSVLRNVLGYAFHNLAGWPVVKAVLPYRLRHRLGPMRLDHCNRMPPSRVQVTQLPALLDFPRRHLARSFYYTGPWTDAKARKDIPFPWERLDGRPLIYASLGTLQNRSEQVFSIILEACSGLEAQLVLTLGGKGLAAPVVNAGAIVVDYAPQLALLKKAALVITHAGLNTTLEAMAEGVPLVAVPITNDQPGVAARIRHIGLGEFIPIGKLSVSRLRQAVGVVLADPSYRQSAKKCADQLREIDGLNRAADLLERALG